MKRITLMVLRNFARLPFLLVQLFYYAKCANFIAEEKRFAFLKKVVAYANQGGNVKVESYGTENIPKEGSFMFFPNHQGMYDVLAMIEGSTRPFSVVMKKELQNIFFLKQIFQVLGAYAMDRDDIRQSMKVIQEVARDVTAGKNVVIFPEGTRSKNGNKIGEFKGGSFKSATKAKCPIVPVAIIDSYKAFDINSVKEVCVQVHYLEPIYYEDYKMMKTTEIAELVSERIEKNIEKFEKKS